MSMRVQAALRTATAPEYANLLADLAADLATSRTDLRRIVAGITPSTLDDGDLASALDRLVGSFQRVTGGPRLTLDVAVDTALSVRRPSNSAGRPDSATGGINPVARSRARPRPGRSRRVRTRSIGARC